MKQEGWLSPTERAPVSANNLRHILASPGYAPVGGVRTGIPEKRLVLRKPESWAIRQRRQFDDRLSRFDTIPACDGQTDRRTDRLQLISITCAV